MVRPAVRLGSNRVCQSGCALLANSARCSASAIWVGTGLLLYVDSPYTGPFKNRSTKVFGLEMSRTVRPSSPGLHFGQFVEFVTTDRGVPSAFSMSIVTGMTGALITLVPLCGGCLSS